VIAEVGRVRIHLRSSELGIVPGVSWLTHGLLLVLVGVLPVHVTKNSGELIEGELLEIRDSTLVVQQGSGSTTVELAFDELLTLVPTKVEETIGPTQRVTLTDGTIIAAQDFSLRDEVLTVEPRRQTPIPLPVKQVRSIRFRVASPLTDPQWLGLLDRPQRGDLLVIRREGDRLDPTEGMVEAIADAKVAFNLDGTVVDAPINRLEGVVFGGASSPARSAAIQVTDRFGSRWLATSISTSQDGTSLKMQLGESLSHTVPLAQLESIRWSGGLTLLATQNPATSSYTPYLQSAIDNKLLESWFGPASDGDADLVMIADSHVEFRLDDDFRTFAGGVSRDDVVTQASQSVVRILFDAQEVWSERLVGAETLGFELPVQGAKRLRIEVKHGDDGDLGDRVRILRPRMLK